MKFLFAFVLLGFLTLGLVKSQDGGCAATGIGPYDYAQALCMSSLFYEAQRSGFLPADQRVTWRGDSAVTDGSDVGVDLEGGYYDAGDFVKFGFPMAYTVTALAWGLIAYPNGYSVSGQTDYAKAAVRWGSDYFQKANTKPTELWGQVGDAGIDHAYWGRPEEMTMARPSDKIDAATPGTDLAAETAAALAAASIVFAADDAVYASECLADAKNLFEFADQDREFYQNSINGANGYYQSYSWNDELVWAALWLYKATGDEQYHTRAINFITEFNLQSQTILNFDWDDKKPGIYALLAELDGGLSYVNAYIAYLDRLLDEQQHTPGGMIYISQWGSLREAVNLAFVALRAVSLGLDGTGRYKSWAQQQIDYALGSQGHSFVCGFGVNPPTQPHHRAASCPDPPATCDWAQNSSPDPNPQILYGAMVGGPDANDGYVDNRNDYIHNEVACDYNALFTGVLSAFVEFNQEMLKK